MENVKLHNDNPTFGRTIDALENTNDSFLITGKAGTGKSTLLREFVEQTKKNVLVLAPTGIAAVNAGGQTIHSAFLFPLRPILPGDEEIKLFGKSTPRGKVLLNVDTIIIDEISMLRADLVDGIDQSLRLNLRQPDKPFGGKQVVMIGDPFQLEPVVTNTDLEKYMYGQHYDSPYFFSASVFKQYFVHCLELKKVYRQSDPYFIGLLDKIRKNEADYDTLENLNSRFNPRYSFKGDDYTIALCTLNSRASSINDMQLARINAPETRYTAAIEGDINLRHMPTDEDLFLRPGAQVVFIKNNPEGHWVNGTIAKVVECKEELVIVELSNGEQKDVMRDKWENVDYAWDRTRNKVERRVKGTFTQMPFKLAWAMTIHKSQGLTFDNVVVDLTGGTFSHGQLYVALSRCRTLDGITLTQRIQQKDIIVDQRVVDFVSRYDIEV